MKEVLPTKKWNNKEKVLTMHEFEKESMETNIVLP